MKKSKIIEGLKDAVKHARCKHAWTRMGTRWYCTKCKSYKSYVKA